MSVPCVCHITSGIDTRSLALSLLRPHLVAEITTRLCKGFMGRRFHKGRPENFPTVAH